ncbi:D-glycero-beta-D-manno-heptose-7-phosphate kinase [Thermodesulfobacteriota bacterium]
MKKLKIKNKRLIELAKGFKNGRVLVVGDVMIDQFIYGSVERISPEAPVPVVAVEDETFMLGGAANVLHNIKGLKGSSTVCGIIGTDIYGKQAKSLFRKVKAPTDGLVEVEGRVTTKKTRIIAHSQQVVRFDKEVKKDISKKILNKLISYIKSNITEFDAVIISDYGKGVVTKELAAHVVDICIKNNRVIIIDPKTNHLDYYKKITSMTPNHHEAAAATGIEIRDEKSLLKAGSYLLDTLKSDSVLITLGDKGMALFEKDGSVSKIPTVAQNVYDVTGAGDTVIATFTLALSVGASFKEAAVLANYAAGVVVGKVGTATVSVDELCNSLEQDK